MRKHKTKIVCTIGPSAWSPEVMRAMIEAGMDCARVNGAFADTNEIQMVNSLVRDISQNVSLMLDVKGPEIRLNKFPEPIEIKVGDIFVIGSDESNQVFPYNYKNIHEFVQKGQRIVIGDGDVELIVEEVKNQKLYCQVVYGEVIKPGKALNMPGIEIKKEILTQKDLENIDVAKKLNWDFVSASFVQSGESARYIKNALEGSNLKLIAKIEDQKGIDNIDSILNEVEGILIARGGLGVELGLEKVPMVQKMLIEKCNAVGKPVITATQMLESMIYNPKPTRAEVNDVAISILQGTDAVMLSGESSMGKYPVEALKTLINIATEIEQNIKPKIIHTKADSSSVADAITKAAAELCLSMGEEIRKVVIASKSGLSARLIGRHNLKQMIFAFTSTVENVRKLSISKGINEAHLYTNTITDRDTAIMELVIKAKEKGLVFEGEKVLFIGKSPVDSGAYFPNFFEVITV